MLKSSTGINRLVLLTVIFRNLSMNLFYFRREIILKFLGKKDNIIAIWQNSVTGVTKESVLYSKSPYVFLAQLTLSLYHWKNVHCLYYDEYETVVS